MDTDEKREAFVPFMNELCQLDYLHDLIATQSGGELLLAAIS